MLPCPRVFFFKPESKSAPAMHGKQLLFPGFKRIIFTTIFHLLPYLWHIDKFHGPVPIPNIRILSSVPLTTAAKLYCMPERRAGSSLMSFK